MQDSTWREDLEAAARRNGVPATPNDHACI